MTKKICGMFFKMTIIICSLPPPASKDVVKTIPEITVDIAGKNCPICLKELKLNEKAKKMPCEHFFHSTCILTWLDKVRILQLILSLQIVSNEKYIFNNSRHFCCTKHNNGSRTFTIYV